MSALLMRRWIGGECLMPSSDYHQRQAELLIDLANTTRDPDTARQLAAMAAEHIELCDQAKISAILSDVGEHAAAKQLI